ncbi:hypothetical protein ISN45_At03g008720 [Arabidopsis thaliana x Arabidopsis arenosa]|uniref:Uncharacterized protein n=2 Tax=Arabidopsis TaxID=3701 RepID=A0A178V6U0_ARATH|nr:hypothetical protein ISN45_At03g008720 [Arabidopsis thaliana x Arabidopsis arenosa]OAP01969.1 hypothetical protein AXX17_AT3G08750 [Arabidopsis thaliana]
MLKHIIDEIESLSLATGFILKNGDFTEEKSLLVKPTMGGTWHWSPIKGLHSQDSIRKTRAYILQEIARMTIYPEAGVSPTLRRKKGIVIGVARAVSTELYHIVENDLIEEEMDTAKLAVGYDGETIVIKNDVDSKWKEELSKPLNLSETENKVIQRLLLISHGVIPLQGYSLVTTSHHYNDKSKRAFSAVERQFFSRCDQLSWWKEDEEALRDAMWHKAGHPVKISFKKEIACSITIKQSLANAGIGSVACRLPATEDVVWKAEAYRNLLKTLSPIFDDEVKWEALDEMLSYLNHFSAARPTEVVTVHNAPTHLMSLDTREKVVTWIAQWCSQNAEKVAICLGFHTALLEKAGKFPGPSYSLMVLKRTNVDSYILGTKLFSDYTVFKAKLRQLMDSVS